MKQQVRLMIVIAVLLLLSLTLMPLAAQDNEPTQVRFGHFVLDGVPVNVYVDDVAFMNNDTTITALAPGTISLYLDVTADAHTFVVVPDGEAMESAIFDPEEFTLEAGRSYLLAMMGNVAADDLHFTLIDETAGLADLDLSLSGVNVFVNNLYGIPAFDLYFAGELVVENLAYGDYVFFNDATEGSGTLVTVYDDPETIIFEYAEAVGNPSGIFAVAAFAGTFPGTLWEDYALLYDTRFAGGLTITDGGTIALGDEVTLNLEMGQRVQYTLTLEADMTLNIMLTEDDETNVADSYLRVYTDAGELVAENNELTTDDDADGNWSAGIEGLTLEAGTYIIEAASAADIYPGTYTLSVSESE
jgi:hypothetical protein